MKNLKKSGNIIFIICAAIILIAILVVNSIINQKETESFLTGKHYVEMTIQDYGTIQLELDADVAPITVTNFMNLVQDHFYDGLTFHRIAKNFVIQGGDPNGNGTGGSKNTIKGEFASNGVANSISHVRGVISMARNGNSNNSASSQFFIMLDDNTSLDGLYAAFGKVIDGMDIIDKIVEDAIIEDDGETVLKENQPVITTARVIDEEK